MNLPTDVLELIIHLIDRRSAIAFRRTCKLWRSTLSLCGLEKVVQLYTSLLRGAPCLSSMSFERSFSLVYRHTLSGRAHDLLYCLKKICKKQRHVVPWYMRGCKADVVADVSMYLDRRLQSSIDDFPGIRRIVLNHLTHRTKMTLARRKARNIVRWE